MVFKENTYKYTNLVDLVLSNDQGISGDKPVYIDANTDETVSYAQLKTLIRQATAGFQRIGLQRGDCVCVFSPNHLGIPPIFLSVLASGGYVCPTNPAFNVQEMEKLLIMSKARYFIAHSSNLDTALKAARLVGIPASNVWCIDDDPKKRAKHWKEIVVDLSEEADPIKYTAAECRNALAYLCFSSGTTGPPKGVKISHHNFIANAEELNGLIKTSKALPNHGNLLAIVPLFHIMGLFRFINMSLIQGRATVMMAQYDLEKMCQMIDKHKITSVVVVPPMLLHLLNSSHIVDKYDFSHVRSFNVGAAPVSLAMAEAITKKFQKPVLQGYGMTEVASVLTVQTPETYMPGSVGRMISGIDAKVVDENGNDLPAGERGEICIKGPIVMLGYLDNPKATAETIDGNGYLHTGDIGYMDKLGNWFIVDRCKELIKFNAYQIAPAELEDTLLKCPLVSDAAVIGIFDDKRQTEVPRAYISLSPAGKALDEQEAIQQIHSFINAKVIHYKRLRGGIQLIDVVPKSVSGKILRKELRALYLKQKQTTSRAKL
ncbi:4-coumarate-CoA ligase [Mucor ambiguus]|uniref:4-coumarate-CoA ligase n=1 Tax=Mucor ambiguus TaxID=91626 RepID=A0A0C9MKX2_9FUNG|nr:4-coumarate-CoA ligase [Mucor ambiguus]